ncbi:MAG: hypothetical protein AAB393_15205 [Bacteroidota bacterium]
MENEGYRSLATRRLRAVTSGAMLHALEEVDERPKLVVWELLAQATKALHKGVLSRGRCGC